MLYIDGITFNYSLYLQVFNLIKNVFIKTLKINIYSVLEYAIMLIIYQKDITLIYNFLCCLFNYAVTLTH